MTSGIQSKGTDLDSIFALYQSGTHPAATGFEVNGTDIATRYQPLPGTQAAATGYTVNGADLNTLFSTTAGPQPTPENGKTFEAQGSMLHSITGTVKLILVSASEYQIQTFIDSTGGPVFDYSVPDGQSYISAALSLVSGDTDAPTDTPTMTALSSVPAGTVLAEITHSLASTGAASWGTTYSCIISLASSSGGPINYQGESSWKISIETEAS